MFSFFYHLGVVLYAPCVLCTRVAPLFSLNEYTFSWGNREGDLNGLMVIHDSLLYVSFL